MRVGLVREGDVGPEAGENGKPGRSRGGLVPELPLLMVSSLKLNWRMP